MHYCFDTCDGNNLATILAERGTLSPADIWQILEDLLPVIQALHARQIIHGDIQPERILQVDDRPSLDSVIKTFAARSPTGIISPEYAAPEQILGKPGFASDLYSLGVTCIYLLTSIHPFTLFDMVNHCWVWQDYWIVDEEDTSNYERLGQILNQLRTALCISRRCDRQSICHQGKEVSDCAFTAYFALAMYGYTIRQSKLLCRC
jgi:serine/threonine protein kinase